MDTVVAVPLTQYFTGEDLARGAEWLHVQTAGALADLLIDVTLLLALAIGRPGRWLWSTCSRIGEGPRGSNLDRILSPHWRAGALFLALLGLLRPMAHLPVTLWVFHVMHVLSLSHEGGLSLARRLSVSAAGSLLGGALLGAVLGAIRVRWPRRWWIVIGSVAAIVLVGQAVLDPLRQSLDFKVQSLPSGALRTRLEALIQDHHMRAADIVVIDASRYGSEVNAWVAGAGPTRRIVLTDTLLALGDEAVAGAVAHEIGHRRDERLPGRLAMACVALIAFLWVVERCIRFVEARGAVHPAQGIPLALAVLAMMLAIVAPIRSAFARDEEREADAVELSIRRDYDAYVAEQVHLARANAIDPDPRAPYTWLLNHPSPMERIGRALWYKQHARPAAPREMRGCRSPRRR